MKSISHNTTHRKFYKLIQMLGLMMHSVT